jgi:hypothetical protein
LLYQSFNPDLVCEKLTVVINKKKTGNRFFIVCFYILIQMANEDGMDWTDLR